MTTCYCTKAECAALSARIANLEALVRSHIGAPVPPAHPINLPPTEAKGDYCTKAECKEIKELAVNALREVADAKRQIGALRARFEAHISKGIPEAHRYKPSVRVDISLAATANKIKFFTRVDVDGSSGNDSETISLPTPKVIGPNPPLSPRSPLPPAPNPPLFPRAPTGQPPVIRGSNPPLSPVLGAFPGGGGLPGFGFRGIGGGGAPQDFGLGVGLTYNQDTGALRVLVQVGPRSASAVTNIDMRQILNLLRQVKNDTEDLKDTVDRSYRILGGDRWFEDGEDPKIDLDVESYVKGYVANQWGLEAEKEDVNAAEIRDVIDVVGAITSLHYFRLGLQEYPLKVFEDITDIPSNDLFDVAFQDVEETLIDIPYVSKFDEWRFKQFDALFGQFPVKIRIEDNDLVKTGDQPIDIKLPNLAETMAELVGKTLTNEALINLLVNMNLRILNETGSAKLQGFKTSKAVEVLTAYFGYEDGKKKEKIRFLYNPLYEVPSEGTANFTEFLKETEIEVIVDELLEKQTLEQKIDNLLYAAAIVRSSLADGVSPNNDRKWNEYVKLFKDLVKSEAEKEKKNNDDFDEFIDKVEAGFTEELGIKDPNKPYGRPRDQRPRIRKLGNNNGAD